MREQKKRKKRMKMIQQIKINLFFMNIPIVKINYVINYIVFKMNFSLMNLQIMK